jgi:hypothetical protein
LRFKKIGDISVSAKKTANGIMVIWKPDSADSTAVNKYRIELRDQDGNEQPIILQKKKLLLFRPLMI